MLLPVFAAMVKDVWDAMRDGGKSIALKKQLLHFNGGLFDKAGALSVNQGQLELLIEAGKADWSHVEPAIFGTLLELCPPLVAVSARAKQVKRLLGPYKNLSKPSAPSPNHSTLTATADEVAKYFIKAKPAAITKLLEDLVELGLAQKSGSPPRYHDPRHQAGAA